MASSYVNDLRLNELATGDGSGTWGTTTNTNLELIGEGLSFGTEAITSNANTHTSTIADGATDPVRSFFVKYTGALDSACTITIAPNTLSRVHFIENATTDSGSSGPYNIIIKQGSGATVTIPNGDTKAVYLDGAGSGAKVVDAFASLNVVDLKVQDDLTVTDDAAVGGLLTVSGGALLNGTTPTLTIGDAGAEDTKIVFDGNAQDFYIALDDSADDLLIGLGSTVGTTPAISIDENLAVKTFGDITMTGATPTLTIGDAGAEDAKIVFDGNAQDFHIGLDDTDDDLVIGVGSALGTTTAISVTEDALVTIEDNIIVSGRASGHVTTDNDGNFDLAVGNDFKCTTAGGLTLTFTNPAVGQSGNVMFINGSNHAIAAHASVAINATVLAAIAATGTYHLAYYCSAASGNNTILVSASAILT